MAPVGKSLCLDCKCFHPKRRESSIVKYLSLFFLPRILQWIILPSYPLRPTTIPLKTRLTSQPSRDAHSQHEEDFTPTLYASKTLLNWDAQIAPLSDKLINPTTNTPYTHVSLYAAEMCHKIPAPLNPAVSPS